MREFIPDDSFFPRAIEFPFRYPVVLVAFIKFLPVSSCTPPQVLVPLFYGAHCSVDGRVAHAHHSVLRACVGGYTPRAAQSAHQTWAGGPPGSRRRVRSPPGPAPPDGPRRRQRSPLGGD